MAKFIYWSLRGVASATFLAAFACVAALLIAMCLYLILSPVLPPSEAQIWQDVRCGLGFPSNTDDQCVQQKISAAIADAEAKKKQAAEALAAAEADAEEKQKKAAEALAAAERARDAAEKALSDQNMVFYEGKAPNGTTLVAGVVFKGKDATSGIARGFCWCTWDRGGYDPRVLIAKIDATGQLEEVQPDNGSRLKSWDETQMTETREACPWPKAN